MTRMAAEMFPPGEFIRDEMLARDWSVADLAGMLLITPAQLERILAGDAPLLAAQVERLADAFGTSTRYWLNLEHGYRQWRKEQ